MTKMKYYSKYIGEYRARWGARYDRFARIASHEKRVMLNLRSNVLMTTIETDDVSRSRLKQN